jgi:hypothetical protein
MSLPDTEPNHTNGTVAGYLGDYPDVDRHSCQLLGPTALVSVTTSIWFQLNEMKFL